MAVTAGEVEAVEGKEGNISLSGVSESTTQAINAGGDGEKVSPERAPAPAPAPAPASSAPGGVRFWMIVVSLGIACFCTALDATIITTALPRITTELGGEQQYIWIANVYVFSCTAVLPFYGQISNIFGRRIPMMTALVFFTVGNVLAGASQNSPMLIASRIITGFGGSGILVLFEVIISDLVPIRERPKYFGIAIALTTVGTIIGPLLGGILAQVSWRWVFFINVPFSVISLAIMVPCLRLKHNRGPWKSSLARVDWIGNAVFIASIIAVLLGLVQGGTVYPWGSYHIIVPLVIGLVGWACFHVFEASPLCKEPTMPPILFQNRTAVVGFVLAFIGGLLLEWVVYYLPIYFQALKGSTPFGSGVNVLPLSVLYIPAAIIAGGVTTKLGQFRAIHFIGFALVAISCGLFSIMRDDTPKVEWAWFQIILAFGIGPTLTVILPAIQASLPEHHVATATGTFNFVKQFGFVWGITIPSLIFNSQIDRYIGAIDDADVRSAMQSGGAYGYAGTGAIAGLGSEIHSQVLYVYTQALDAVWWAAAAFAAVGALAVLFEKHIVMRTEVQTDFGLEEKTPVGKEEVKV